MPNGDEKPTFWQWISGMSDYPEFEEYQRMGGGLSYNQWSAQDKPSPPTAITQRTAGIYERAGQPLPAKATVAPPTPGERAEAMRVTTPQQPTPTGVPPAQEAPAWIGAYEPPPFPTGKAPEGYDWRWDSQAMRYVLTARARPAPVAEELSAWQEEQIRLEEGARQAELAEQGRERQWQEQQAAQAQEQWQQEQQMQQQQFQQQMGWYQQQAMMQQQEMERQERARLSAQPMSWLQYASYTGETPAIQPWMQPLMGGTAGEAIPGITPTSMAGMPQLTQPSAQLWSRMGPTAQQQFAGYRQARTGQRPEETQFRMASGAPPGGRSPGLSWTR